MADRENTWPQKFAGAVFLLALVVYPMLLSRYARASSPTFDEGMHIAAGYRYWQCADYGINPEHPPLAKLLAAAPLRHATLDEFDWACGSAVTKNDKLLAIGYRLVNGESAEDLLERARKATMLFPILLLVIIFFSAKAWFGWLAAGFAVLLTVFEPNLTAHGPLVATDMALAVTTLFTVYCADRYLREPAATRLLLLGVALGMALASKHTAVFVPIIVLLQFLVNLWLVRKSSRSVTLLRSLLAWFAAGLLGVLLLWGSYQFRYTALPGEHAEAFEITKVLESDGRAGTLFGHVVGGLARFHLLPESYLAGLLYVLDNSTRACFLFGKQLGTGVWYYFPVTILVKTPLTILALVFLAMAMPSVWRGRSRELVTVAIPVAVFLLAAMSGKINLGVRHILPVYPFLILMAAAAATYCCKRSKAAVVVCAALFAFQAISYSRSFPNQIAYANEAWGGPKQLHRYLGDSSVDWGQSLYQVKDYVDQHAITDCWIAWAGPRKPQPAGLPCRVLAGPSFLEAADTTLPPVLPAGFSGTVFVSNLLTNYKIFPYHYFLEHPPEEVIAGSVLVYRGEFALPEIAAERRVARGWWYLNHQQAPQAVEEFLAAEPHVASPGILHSLYGWALEASGRPGEAREKYAQAAVDFAGLPADARARKAALERVAALGVGQPHR